MTQSNELSVIAQDPLALSTRTFAQRLTDQISSYSQEIRRVGGYWSARMRISDRQSRIEDWIENGLGRHIEVYSPSLSLIWAGFVNNITTSLGGTSYQVGPLMRIGNQVTVTYSIGDQSLVPASIGGRETTDVANNTDSQALYGIIQKRYGINIATTTQAETLRDLFVSDPGRAYPPTSRDSDIGGSGLSMSLDCLGYWHWFGTYYYEQITAAGQVNLSQKIVDVRVAQVNDIISSDNSQITENTFQVKNSYSGNETADVVLKRLASLGDASNNPYNLGVYEDQVIVYEQVPTEIEYQLKLQDNIGIADKLGGIEKPWNVLPGRWVFDPYFLVGRTLPTTLSTLSLDPRATIIEGVRFDAPWGLSINGVKLSQLDQTLARRGLGGL